jgi:hypothetical protein
MHREIKKCRICNDNNLVLIIDLGDQAFTGIFPKSVHEEVPTGKLELVKCMNCGLVQLKHTFDLDLMYGFNYGYRSGLNRSMVTHLRDTVKNIIDFVKPEKNDLVIDIGSNDSTLLQAYPGGLDLLGVDPTGKKFKDYYPDHIALVPDFFPSDAVSRQTGDKKAKIVTSIAMFYDLEEPEKFMKAIYDKLHDDGIWYFEQSYLPTMIEMNSYDTICHEHLEYYTLKQIKWMTDNTGFRILDVNFNTVNGGSFNIMVCKENAKYKGNEDKINMILQEETEKGYDSLQVFIDFKERVNTHRDHLLEFLDREKSKGKRIFGYGASTKGNVLLQYCGINKNHIEFIAEVNDDKFGSFTPGSLIPIVSESEAKEKKPDYFIVLPWHFKDYILSRETEYLDSGGHFVFPLPDLEII